MSGKAAYDFSSAPAGKANALPGSQSDADEKDGSRARFIESWVSRSSGAWRDGVRGRATREVRLDQAAGDGADEARTRLQMAGDGIGAAPMKRIWRSGIWRRCADGLPSG